MKVPIIAKINIHDSHQLACVPPYPSKKALYFLYDYGWSLNRTKHILNIGTLTLLQFKREKVACS